MLKCVYYCFVRCGLRQEMCLYLEDLEAVDVEDSDVELLLLLLHGFINTLTQKQEGE